MQPWPKPFTFLHQPEREPLRTLILNVDPAELPETAEPLSPGAVVFVNETQLLVRTGDGAVAIHQLQPAGKRAMSVADFLHGHPVSVGDRFDPEKISDN